VTLVDEVECDEAYVIAGHKGQPEVVKNKGRQGRRRRLKGKSGRGTLEKERPPVFGRERARTGAGDQAERLLGLARYGTSSKSH
jgi:hypothetical protein